MKFMKFCEGCIYHEKCIVTTLWDNTDQNRYRYPILGA